MKSEVKPVEYGESGAIRRQYFKKKGRDFPGGTVVKNPPANAGDTGSSPGLGRSHMCGANKPMRHSY